MTYEENERRARAKFDAHLDEILTGVAPEKIGARFADAMERGDRAAAIAALAGYYRTRPEWQDPDFMAGSYDKPIADNAVRGVMREISVNYTFPDGKIDFLFNPTLEHPPVNHEWLWQFNRHSYWTHMARAYADLGDELYAETFNAQLRQWVAQTDLPAEWNTPGSAWRTIECGIRLMGSWQVAFNLFRSSPSVEDETLLLMISSMHRQAVHLIAHPRTGNWLMMESAGCYAFGSLFPEFSDALAICNEAEERLTRELGTQILPDGFQYELSPDYHLVTFSCAANLYKVAEATGKTDRLPAYYLDTMRRMANASIALMTPGMIQPLTNDTHVMRSALTTRFAGRMFPDDEQYRYVNTARKEGRPPEGATASRFLPYAGFCAMRSGWDRDASYLCFDVGPLGMAHIHQDKLNVNIYKGDDELIFDDGGGQYEISPARRYALSAADHNTILIDGMGQSRKEPYISTEPIDATWTTCEDFDYARGVYDGEFGGGKLFAVHTREVRFCKPDFFCIYDTIRASDGQPHRFDLLFHIDTPKVDPVPEIPGAFLSDIGRTYDVLVVPVPIPGESAEDVRAVSGQTEPNYLGWYVGRDERDQHIATTLLRSSQPTAGHRFMTLIFPVRRGDPLPTVTTTADGLVRVLTGGKEYLLDRENLCG